MATRFAFRDEVNHGGGNIAMAQQFFNGMQGLVPLSGRCVAKLHTAGYGLKNLCHPTNSGNIGFA
jgi:hypothetical protein